MRTRSRPCRSPRLYLRSKFEGRIEESRSFLKSPIPINGRDFSSRPVDPPSSVVHTTMFRFENSCFTPDARLIRPIRHLRIASHDRGQSRAAAENYDTRAAKVEAQSLLLPDPEYRGVHSLPGRRSEGTPPDARWESAIHPAARKQSCAIPRVILWKVLPACAI